MDILYVLMVVAAFDSIAVAWRAGALVGTGASASSWRSSCSSGSKVSSETDQAPCDVRGGMTETIRSGDIVRTKGIRSPSMFVVRLHLQADDSEIAELLWFDANMNARQVNLSTDLLEHVPLQD